MNYRHVYFIGIGGIGMSAIARYFHRKGTAVSGYDHTPSPLTGELESEGIPIHYDDRPDLVPDDVQGTLVVYTPAVPQELAEMQKVFAGGYKVVKRSRMLGEIARGQRCLAVAGTHGKTTTSTLIAHILTESGEGCSAFLGGISKNYGTNLLISNNPTIVAEADEFDRSFLQLFPETAVITAMDADHLDIYGDLEHVQEAYRQFASQVSGTLIYKYGLPLDGDVTRAHMLSYSVDEQGADFHSLNLRLDDTGHYSFDLSFPGGMLCDIKVGALGRVNVENSIAAAAVCLCYGIAPEAVKAAIASFEGARRRLDLHVSKPGLTYIDDYAHHPAEIAAALRSIRGIFPHRKITAVFQPHLYTRTRDFAPEFAAALGTADEVVLLDIYPARELPIEGVTSELIYKDLDCPRKVMLHKDQLIDYLAGESPDVLVTLGAGDIDRFIEPITQLLLGR